MINAINILLIVIGVAILAAAVGYRCGYERGYDAAIGQQLTAIASDQ